MKQLSAILICSTALWAQPPTPEKMPSLTASAIFVEHNLLSAPPADSH